MQMVVRRWSGSMVLCKVRLVGVEPRCGQVVGSNRLSVAFSEQWRRGRQSTDPTHERPKARSAKVAVTGN
jgi:hypothetical protein